MYPLQTATHVRESRCQTCAWRPRTTKPAQPTKQECVLDLTVSVMHSKMHKPTDVTRRVPTTQKQRHVTNINAPNSHTPAHRAMSSPAYTITYHLVRGVAVSVFGVCFPVVQVNVTQPTNHQLKFSFVKAIKELWRHNLVEAPLQRSHLNTSVLKEW